MALCLANPFSFWAGRGKLLRTSRRWLRGGPHEADEYTESVTMFYATIARYYDAEHTDKTDDLILYSELADETGGPILDVGCGTGRVMFHLAQEGHVVHGIDSEYAMLERAKVKLNAFGHIRDKLRFHHGDVLTYDLGMRFKLALLSYNALMHFHTHEVQRALLKRLHEALEVDGLLVIDLPNAGDAFASPDSDAITLERSFVDAETGHLVMQQATSSLDRVEQLMRVNWIYDEITADGTLKRTLASVIFRHFFYSELSLLLEMCGFRIEDVYGSAERDPFEDGCERMIILARPV
ncbi:MAG: class I SAM-dependent methyltransferase [Anaerolineae bacterium]|nr:class I SAM-dependent methyltransferase [Anaerolineae bacterium]